MHQSQNDSNKGIIQPQSLSQQIVYGSPGARPRGLGLLKSLWPVGLILFAMGYLVRTALPYPPIPHGITSILFLAVAIGIAATANQARRKMGNHAKGAQGEELAARLLAQLPPEYVGFHGVTLQGGWRDLEGGADIDHVVVGPNAIFAIETKHWQGSLTLENGCLLQDDILPDRDPIKQTLHAAQRVKRLLAKHLSADIPVMPVLLFSASPIPHLPENLHGVILTDSPRLLGRIEHQTGGPLSANTRENAIQLLARRVEP